MPDVRKLCVVCSKVYRTDITTCPDDGTKLVAEATGADQGTRLGRVVGNYRLLRVLGEGGVGTVYEAEHIRLGRKMALKLLHADMVTREMVQRFFNEARAVNEIRHPNIIEVEDFVTTPTGEHYMLMELLEGEDLRRVISREGTLAPERVAAIGEQVASALAAVHKVKILHRDLKPDNIFIQRRDGKEVYKLLDFGVAKFTKEDQGLTRAGMTMGTPQYMAPEMIITGRERDVGAPADIYALGMVMYEALTGEPAFDGMQLAAILRAHCFAAVPPPSQRRGEPISPILEAAVMKCLEKVPENRFADAAELCAALRAEKPVKLSGEVVVPRAEIRKVKASRRRAVLMLPAFAMAAAALALQLWPRSDDAAVAAPARAATAPMPATKPAAITTITIGLSSKPTGAQLFLGADRTPLGSAPLATTLARSTELVQLVARFPDGTEVVQSVVPDRELPELVFEKPAAVTPKPLVPVKKPPATARRYDDRRATPPPQKNLVDQPDDRDATLDPFKKP